MIGILEIQEGLWVLEEEGQNVLLKDCLRFGVSKAERKRLFQILAMVTEQTLEYASLEPMIKQGIIKMLHRQPKALQESVGEARDVAGGGRVVFILMEPNTVVVSAVHKSWGSLTQAINRGVNRWQDYLKSCGRFPFPIC